MLGRWRKDYAGCLVSAFPASVCLHEQERGGKRFRVTEGVGLNVCSIIGKQQKTKKESLTEAEKQHSSNSFKPDITEDDDPSVKQHQRSPNPPTADQQRRHGNHTRMFVEDGKKERKNKCEKETESVCEFFVNAFQVLMAK